MVTEEKATRRQTCTDHCATCDRHFHGLGAFDLHRRGECLEPLTVTVKDRPALQVWTEQGYCDLQVGTWHDGKRLHWLHPVVVYQVYQTEEQRQRLQDAWGKKSDAVSANRD